MASTSGSFVIGVDGGGTKTIGVLLDMQRREVCRETFPSSNPHSNPPEMVSQVLQTLVASLCERAGTTPRSLACVCLGMAGCDSEADRQKIEGFIRPALDTNTKLLVVNDALVAMRALLGKLHGMLLIAGTGSICLGVNERTGVTGRCGGWGHLLADEGSGYLIGLEALKAIIYAVDARGPETSLAPLILQHLEFKGPRDILGWVYGGPGNKAGIASLSRFVMEQAAAGDRASIDILERQSDLLVQLVRPVFTRYFANESGKTPLGLWGGNLVKVPLYRDMFVKRLNAAALPIEIICDENADAVLGAAWHAIDAL